MKQYSNFIKQLIYHILAVLLFLCLTVAFYKPVFIENKTLEQHDISQFSGGSQDIREYYENEGKTTEWTGSMFSGMPSYQLIVMGGSPNFLNYLDAPFRALGFNMAGPLFASLFVMYIVLIFLGCSVPLSILGAVAYAFSSYNLIIIDAGHATKAWTLAFMPLTVGGFLMLFRKEYLPAIITITVGLSLQIKSNHVQMVYYTGICCFIIFLYYTLKEFYEKKGTNWIKSSLLIFVGVTIALLANAGKIYGNYEMSQTSTRGQSELVSEHNNNEFNEISNGSPNVNDKSGLDKDYVFGWSYGLSESLSFMIPNIKGGSSQPFDENSNLMHTVSRLYQNGEINGESAMFFLQNFRQYWGDQPMTSGPVYFGAIVCFLFILGLSIIRNNLKWVFFAIFLFFLFLSWGSNLEWFNDVFYYYFPLYNKFRAVSQTLVIPALIAVLLAVWGLFELKKEQNIRLLTLKFYWIWGVFLATCLVLWLIPETFFSFTTIQEESFRTQIPPQILSAILSDRQQLMSNDAFRSLIYIFLAGLAILIWIKNKEKSKYYFPLIWVIAILILIDLWNVDNRYLPDSKFVAKKQKLYNPSIADKSIIANNANGAKVFNLHNPFQETQTSYFHRSVGGYHAAKLQRYQQLIERRLNTEHNIIISGLQDATSIDSIDNIFEQTPTLNMLNAKYIIYNQEAEALVNSKALGNAWFVKKIVFAENPNQEIKLLNIINPKEEAVVDISNNDISLLSNLKIDYDSLNTIKQISYSPNNITYRSETTSEQFGVFSEVFYKQGWKAFIDGVEVPIYSADWILRAVIVPKGNHEIEFKFIPTTYKLARMVETSASGILIILILITAYMIYFRQKRSKLK